VTTFAEMPFMHLKFFLMHLKSLNCLAQKRRTNSWPQETKQFGGKENSGNMITPCSKKKSAPKITAYFKK